VEGRLQQPRIQLPLHPGYACYGEQFVKVQTEAPERENRRIAIRRITDLVRPGG
jgi:hypothetical protein